jgi:hypothetical protein
MPRFPLIDFCKALIAIGRGSSNQFFEERRRDRIARKVLLVLGIGICILLGFLFL